MQHKIKEGDNNIFHLFTLLFCNLISQSVLYSLIRKPFDISSLHIVYTQDTRIQTLQIFDFPLKYFWYKIVVENTPDTSYVVRFFHLWTPVAEFFSCPRRVIAGIILDYGIFWDKIQTNLTQIPSLEYFGMLFSFKSPSLIEFAGFL